MKNEYAVLEIEEDEIPDWQKSLVRERIAEYRRDPSKALDADSCLDEIEKEL